MTTRRGGRPAAKSWLTMAPPERPLRWIDSNWEFIMTGIREVVLVHGGFVDGSGWQGVYDLLKADGFNVSIVQNPTLSLDGDVAATRMVLDAQEGPAVLV